MIPGTGEQRRQSRKRGQLWDEELREEKEGRRETHQELIYWFFSWYLGSAEHISMPTAHCLSRLNGLNVGIHFPHRASVSKQGKV